MKATSCNGVHCAAAMISYVSTLVNELCFIQLTTFPIQLVWGYGPSDEFDPGVLTIGDNLGSVIWDANDPALCQPENTVNVTAILSSFDDENRPCCVNRQT